MQIYNECVVIFFLKKILHFLMKLLKNLISRFITNFFNVYSFDHVNK